MQNYMLERLLERVSVSEYKNSFILKGGYLISSIVGLDSRATMDMDATIKGIQFSQKSVMDMFLDITQINLLDDVSFSFLGITNIREDDEYGGYRISLTADFPPMSVPLKIDITTGDTLTPKEVAFDYKLLFENRNIKVWAYNLETVLAEKLETIITRSDQNTRLRDFYDVYIIERLKSDMINMALLRDAVLATAAKRNSIHILNDHKQIIEVIRGSEIMHRRWSIYQKDFNYAKNIQFEHICDVILNISETLL